MGIRRLYSIHTYLTSLQFNVYLKLSNFDIRWLDNIVSGTDRAQNTAEDNALMREYLVIHRY